MKICYPMFCIVLQFTHLHEILTQDPNHTILLFLSYISTSLLLFCSFFHDLRSYLRTAYATNQFLFSFFKLTFCQTMNGSFSLKERKIKSFLFIFITIHHRQSACIFVWTQTCLRILLLQQYQYSGSIKITTLIQVDGFVQRLVYRPA